MAQLMSSRAIKNEKSAVGGGVTVAKHAEITQISLLIFQKTRCSIFLRQDLKKAKNLPKDSFFS